jgi:hypothetical protein
MGKRVCQLKSARSTAETRAFLDARFLGMAFGLLLTLSAAAMKPATLLTAFLCVFASISNVAEAAGSEVAQYLKRVPRMYYAYDGFQIKDQSQVATIVPDSGLTVFVDGKELRRNRYSGPHHWDSWIVGDLPPGTHNITATLYVSTCNSTLQSREFAQLPVTVEAGKVYNLGYQIIGNWHRPSDMLAWKLTIVENTKLELREKIAKYRQDFVNEQASKPQFTTSGAEEDWGKKWAAVSVPQNLSVLDVRDAVTQALELNHWTIERVEDGVAVGSLTRNLDKIGIYVKFDQTEASIYGDALSKNWTERIKQQLAGLLKYTTQPDAKAKFTLDYPREKWGAKWASISLAQPVAKEVIKQRIVGALKSSGWEIANSNDALVIGSHMRGAADKMAMYATFTGTQIDIYCDKQDKARAANLEQKLRKQSPETVVTK